MYCRHCGQYCPPSQHLHYCKVKKTEIPVFNVKDFSRDLGAVCQPSSDIYLAGERLEAVEFKGPIRVDIRSQFNK